MTGKPPCKERLRKNVHFKVVISRQRVYLLTEDGEIQVKKSVSSTTDKQVIDAKGGTSEKEMSGQNLGVPSFPAASSPQRIAGSPQGGRNKVQLKPGHSLMDWIRLGRSGKDLTGVGGRKMDISMEELKKHNTEGDAWLALRGKVYNVTPYLDFHPGGVDELMKGAGKDATALFDEIHKWVNAESMLEKCLIGKLKVENTLQKQSMMRKDSKTKDQVTNGQVQSQFLVPAVPPMQTPRFDWYQSNKTVSVVVYTKWTAMSQEYIIVDRQGRTLLILYYIKDHIYHVHLELDKEVTDGFKTQISSDSGKVEIMFNKTQPDVNWSVIGRNLENHNKYISYKDYRPVYRECTIDKVEQVTRDCYVYTVCLPSHVHMSIPAGYHVHMQHVISGMCIVRSYTAVLPSLQTDQQDRRVQDGQAFYLMIKIYKDGAFTPWLSTLKPGDKVSVSSYEGTFSVPRLTECSHLILLAAGTGFTPMVQLIYKTIVQDKQSKRPVKLLFFNKTEADIVWRDQLTSLADQDDRFTFTNCLSEAGESWDGLRGRVSKEMVKEFLPEIKPTDKLLVCVCGPTPFTNTVIQFVEELGYKDSAHAFLG